MLSQQHILKQWLPYFDAFIISIMFRSQKNLQQTAIDYKALYLEEKKIKEEFQRRAHVAELKFRKLAQTVNKKCIRCMYLDEKTNRQEKIWQLKQFQEGLPTKDVDTFKTIPVKNSMNQQKVIENFAVFGIPESILVEPEDFSENTEGELLFISDIPSDNAMHSAKLAFPNGVPNHYYSGSDAKQKSIEIMSNNCSYLKTFIMSFESQEEKQPLSEIKGLVNPENRLYAVCLRIDDFTLVPAFEPFLIESEKVVKAEEKESVGKVLSCEETDITNQNENDYYIVVSPRIYCVFSKYPFFSFFENFLKSIVSNVKTERLVIYRESGCSIAEADSHFFLNRVKETYRELSQQFENWELKLNREYEIKLITCQKINLKLEAEMIQSHFIYEWGLAVLKKFTVESFIDILTLTLLEQKIVFVCENPFILTFTIHLFTRLLPRPFKYPYPTVSLLPNKQEYLNTPFPVVYGYLNSKKNLIDKNYHQDYPNVYIVLENASVEIISVESKKNVLRKRPKSLSDALAKKFKLFVDSSRRTSRLTFTDQESNAGKDRDGICRQIVKSVNNYLNDEVLMKLPSPEQISLLKTQFRQRKEDLDPNQQVYEQILRKYQQSNKIKDEFYKALLETQLINVYLFK